MPSVRYRLIDRRQFQLSGEYLVSTGVSNLPGYYLVLSPNVLHDLGGGPTTTTLTASLATSSLFQSTFDPLAPAADFTAANWVLRGWTNPQDLTAFRNQLRDWLTQNVLNTSLNPGNGDLNLYLADLTISQTRYLLPIAFVGSDGPSISNELVTQGLQLHLDAGNPNSYPGSGTLWTDISGNGRHGTLNNGVGYNSANGGYLTFDGSNDWVSTNYDGVSGQTARTVSIWFYPNLLQSRNLLGWGSQNNNRMWDILLFGSNIGVHVYNSGSEAGAAYAATTWQQITFTYTHPTIRSYMNGVYKNMYTNNGLNTGTGEKFNIGRGIYPNYAYFNGRIAQVLMYNRELSSSEILQNFESARGRFNV